MNKKNYSNYKNKQKNYNFWLDRLKKNKGHLVCSKDVRLNNLENDFMVKNIKKNKSILEIGCGNAVLLKKLTLKKPKYYLGTEFVRELTEYNKKTLKKGGKMLLMESSINAQKNINKYRKIFNLHKITPPWHNLFLDDEILKKYRFKNVKLKKIENFSSNFYFITRIIYAAYAKLKNIKVNFTDPLNIIASSINKKILSEDFSQIKLYVFIKKNEM